MNSINKFCVLGRLVSDPEMKELENGKKVVNVTVAVDRDYKDKEGNKITDFLNYSLWDKNAEKICSMSKKGSLINLEGYNTTKQIETDKGKINVIQPVVDVFKHITLAKNTEIEQTSSKDKEVEI